MLAVKVALSGGLPSSSTVLESFVDKVPIAVTIAGLGCVRVGAKVGVESGQGKGG